MVEYLNQLESSKVVFKQLIEPHLTLLSDASSTCRDGGRGCLTISDPDLVYIKVRSSQSLGSI